MGERAPAVAGQFYPADGAELARTIERCFLDARGPGELPARHRRTDRHIRAAIVPHAGYLYSGPIAALAFDRIAAERPPDHVVLLGVDHHGVAADPALCDDDWITPLGRVPTDRSLLDGLDRPPLRRDARAHRLEHSIEVELPFLQYVLPAPTIVALTVPFADLRTLETVGAAVAAGTAGRDVLLLASTDFSHYVPAAEAERLDAAALRAIVARDAAALYATVEAERISMCGIAPVTALLAALAPEPLTARLLRWGHSGEAQPMADVVGYAALLLESVAPLPPSSPPVGGLKSPHASAARGRHDP